jgi:chromate transporter
MRERSAPEVLVTFLKLGLTSFGGPIAHIGYYREEIVVRRRWVDDATYTDLVALCQFLPGPASSQVGFSLGLIRANYLGALAAWTGFTLPSAILMTAFAYGASALGGPLGLGVLHGLKLVAVAIVAQAVWGMARTLCPDWQRASIACVAALMILFTTSAVAQIGAILMGGIAGLWLCRQPAPSLAKPLGVPVSRRVGVLALASFFILLIALPALGSSSHGVELFDAFYRSGALVFGGGHVVLPLLSKAFVTPGWVSQDSFLAGYGAAQAVPGPLFTFAAYLGAVAEPSNGIAGAALGLLGIFLPGFLVLIGTLPFWDAFRQRVSAQAAMRGINAAVVGLLGAALYNPLWISSVSSSGDFALALAGFVLLTAWRTPPLIVVILGAIGGIALSITTS